MTGVRNNFKVFRNKLNLPRYEMQMAIWCDSDNRGIGSSIRYQIKKPIIRSQFHLSGLAATFFPALLV